jgi:hypothetical protein
MRNKVPQIVLHLAPFCNFFENATHNTFAKVHLDIFALQMYCGLPPGSLSLVKYPVQYLLLLLYCRTFANALMFSSIHDQSLRGNAAGSSFGLFGNPCTDP